MAALPLPILRHHVDWIGIVSRTAVTILPTLSAIAYFAIAIWVLLAGHLHEDAYILFTYVENLALGNGIVYYAGGPPTEGATDFLWTIVLAAATRLGADAGIAAAVLNATGIGVICYIAIHHLPEGLDRYWRLIFSFGVCAIIVLSPIASAGFGGFSSPAFAAIAVTLFALFLARRYTYLPWIGLLLGLVRPDGVVIGCTFALLGLTVQWNHPSMRRYAAHLFLAAIVGCIYFLWRASYFDQLLPLPLYVKGSGDELLPGISDNLDWISGNLFLICLGLTAFFHQSIDKRRLALAALPFLLLLVALGFANQTQNVSFRFQAPLTTILIILLAMSAGHWVKNRPRVTSGLGAILGFALLLPIIGASAVSSMRDLLGTQYINYLPFHLARSMSPNTKVALTEAGRIAYWTDGKKFDLVGLNSVHPAVNGLDLDYMGRLQPDIVFIHTAQTLMPWPDRAEPYFSVSIADVRQKIAEPRDWQGESDPVNRAPLVVYEFLAQYESDYDIVMVRYYGMYAHLYAIRRSGAVPFSDFIAALDQSFTGTGQISYWVMKQRRQLEATRHSGRSTSQR